MFTDSRSRRALVVALVALATVGLTDGYAQQTAATGRAMVSDPQWMLGVAPDESLLEEKIEQYLAGRAQWQAERRYLDEAKTDLALAYRLPLTLDPDGPTLMVLVDTQPSAGGDEVTERAISISSFLVLPDEHKTPETLARIRQYNNDWLQRKWAPDRVFLDRDDDVQFETWVNIPAAETPVHAELVYDAIARMRSGFTEYSDGLNDVLE